MKRLVLMILAGIMLLTLVGCGEAQPTETTFSNVIVENVLVEHVEVEETLVEETLTEETLTERVCIDDEYQNEVDYNSRVNTWDNSNTITRWS